MGSRAFSQGKTTSSGKKYGQNSRWKYGLFWAIQFLIIVAVFSFPPVAQDPEYHNFADVRTFFMIPNMMDVTSNILYLVAGVWGAVLLIRRPSSPDKIITPGLRLMWLICFISLAMIAFGSGYYHLLPNNHTLLWDRLPMSLAFMTLLAILMAERWNEEKILCLWPVLLILGGGSVLYWYQTELSGAGDLRAYAITQFGGLLAMVMLLIMWPARYTRQGDLVWVLICYIVAKLLEFTDISVFEVSQQLISGHTLKHYISGIGAVILVYHLHRRESRRLQ